MSLRQRFLQGELQLLAYLLTPLFFIVPPGRRGGRGATGV